MSSPIGALAYTFWNLYARVYDTLLMFRPYQCMLTEAADSVGLPAGSRVLDAGCGTGNLTRPLGERGYQVLALDSSPHMLQRARMKHPHLQFQSGDLGGVLPFPSESFDAITCSNVLYTLPDPAAALQEFRRVLRPGGKLVVTNPVPGCRAEEILQHEWRLSSLPSRLRLLTGLPGILMLLIFNRFLLTPERRARLYCPDRRELEQVLEQAGFRAREVRRVYADQSWLVVAEAGS